MNFNSAQNLLIFAKLEDLSTMEMTKMRSAVHPEQAAPKPNLR
jgi:hypothetical protein